MALPGQVFIRCRGFSGDPGSATHAGLDRRELAEYDARPLGITSQY